MAAALGEKDNPFTAGVAEQFPAVPGNDGFTVRAEIRVEMPACIAVHINVFRHGCALAYRYAQHLLPVTEHDERRGGGTGRIPGVPVIAFRVLDACHHSHGAGIVGIFDVVRNRRLRNDLPQLAKPAGGHCKNHHDTAGDHSFRPARILVSSGFSSILNSLHCIPFYVSISARRKSRHPGAKERKGRVNGKKVA